MRLKRSSIFMKIVIAALIIYGVISIADTRSQIDEAQRELAELEQMVEDARRENAELQYDIEHAGDDATIMDIARAKLGLVMPGEIIFYDIGN